MACFHSADPPRRGVRCDGCDHLVYSAPGGQALEPAPHSRCGILHRSIPIVLGERGDWVASAIPPECPIVAQGGVPGSAHSSALAITTSMVDWCTRLLGPLAFPLERARRGALWVDGSECEEAPSEETATRLLRAGLIKWERTSSAHASERAALTDLGRAIATASLPQSRFAEHQARMQAARDAGLI